MERCDKNGLRWLTFDLLSDCPRLTHGVFLRHGGVSSGEFDSLNFGTALGDHFQSVSINIQRALDALGIKQYVNLRQHHSDHIIEAKPYEMAPGDSLITDKHNLGLLILHADCQAAIFYDPVRHVLANVHSGWRGSVANIYEKTIEKMKLRYGTKPEDLLVGISPSLGPHAAEFRHFKSELPESFWPYQIKPSYFDFWEISRMQLKCAGVLSHHIEIAEICTYTESEDFFSYRRVKKSGRHGTLAVLEN